MSALGGHAQDLLRARYADWLGTTPLLLLDLALLAGLSGVDIVMLVFAEYGRSTKRTRTC